MVAQETIGMPDVKTEEYSWGPYERSRGTNVPTIKMANLFRNARNSCSHDKIGSDSSLESIDSRILLLGRTLCEGSWSLDSKSFKGRSNLNPSGLANLARQIRIEVQKDVLDPIASPPPYIPQAPTGPSKLNIAVTKLHPYAMHPAANSDAIRYAGIKYQAPELFDHA